MKKIYTIIFAFCLLLTASPALAQHDLRHGSARKTKTTTSSTATTSAKSVTPQPSLSKSQVKTVKEPDTLYATRTKKQHGWFAPMDTISKEHASHLNAYYRFTMKNKAGHWGRMECLNAYGNYRKGLFSPYIMKLSDANHDQNVNDDWVDKLGTTCIYEFIGDYTGETIIQERAYDEDMNIIYTFSRVPIGNHQYIGSYKDSYGMPAEMRSEEGYTYGTLVKITEDRFGNDSVIQYIDAKGLPKLNSDSAAIEVFSYDEEGRHLTMQSRNADGTLAIDNWGNCGVMNVWNGYQIESSTYMDDHWQPMRMPAERASEHLNTIRSNYIYDSLGREIEEYFTDTEGKPDTNAFGSHKAVYHFDTHGNITEWFSYDLSGNLSAWDEGGIAQYRHYFDDFGRDTCDIFRDKNGKPFSTETTICKRVKHFNEKGEESYYAQYEAVDGKEVMTYRRVKTDKFMSTMWSDGSYRVDSFDTKGRTTFIGSYAASGKLEMVGGDAYHTYDYKDNGKITIETLVYYDTAGNRIDNDGICETVIKIDSANWTKSFWKYDAKGTLVNVYILRYDENFTRSIKQYDVNRWGTVGHCGGDASMMFYEVDIMRNHDGSIASYTGKDEFGEPSYIKTDSRLYCYTKQWPHKSNEYYDEDNNLVTSVKKLRDSLPKLMTIEVVDSVAYSYGLRDNDLILIYGDYFVDLRQEPDDYYDFRGDWCLRSVLDARKIRRMVVFRVEDAANQKFGLVEINNLQGTPSELGFLAHIRYLTKRQTARIVNAIKENMRGEKPIVNETDFMRSSEIRTKKVVFAHREMYRSEREKTYPKLVTDPAIVLGACVLEKGLTWTMGEDEATGLQNILDSRDYPAASYPTMHTFFTKDMESTVCAPTNSQYVSANMFFIKISEKDYQKLLQLSAQVAGTMKKFKLPKQATGNRDLIGQWRMEETEGVEGHTSTGTLTFSKNGRCSGTLTTYEKVSYKEGKVIFKLETSINGKWDYNGAVITITPTPTQKLSCLDILDCDENDKERLMDLVKGICNDNPKAFLDDLSFSFEDGLFGRLHVRSISSDTLIFETEDDAGLQFVRTGGKSKRKSKASE